MGVQAQQNSYGRRQEQGLSAPPFAPAMDLQEFLAKPRGMQVLDDALKRTPKSWLALDDDGLGWPDGHLAKLIKTHPHEGISDPAVQEELRAKLKELYRA